MLLDSETNKSYDNQLPKSPTGIQGLDEITGGGLPQGRPTLICGTAGSGKTLIGLNFLVSGVVSYSEPGVFVSFEETPDELIQNVRSLGWDLKKLIAEKQFLIDHIQIDPYEIEETGDYNLEALFIRLEQIIDAIAAKRIVLDTIETLFVGLTNTTVVRSELQRLFRWLKSKGVTAIITGEKGENTLTRHGLEEYVADCVIRLEQRVQNEFATRRLQIIKYRGSNHGTNEYPFLINDKGISVLPITSVGLDHEISTERISTGIPRLDTMLGGQGYFRGSSVLITGTAGTGKSTIAAHFAQATCSRGERCLYLAFEEAPQQILRNMLSVGLDLHPLVSQGLLKFQAVRPTAFGLEMHLVQIHNLINEFQPNVVIVDPMSNLVLGGNLLQSKSFFMRLIDSLKSQQITVMLTNLLTGNSSLEYTEIGISSLMDTWLELRVLESNGERNRVLYVLKSRGMEHSNQVREFILTKKGIKLVNVYLGQETVLTGTARNVQEAKEKATNLIRQQELERKRRELERKQAIMRSQIAALQDQLNMEEEEFQMMIEQEKLYQDIKSQSQIKVADLRQADVE